MTLGFGLLLSLYAWWCIARPKSAANFPYREDFSVGKLGDSFREDMNKFHGILAGIIGPIVTVYGIYAIIRSLFHG